MKHIIQNRYFKGTSFLSSEEALIFLNSQETNRKISLDETFGDNYYCYVCCHALTQEKLFALSFSSDEREDNLIFLYWNNLIVLYTGKNIYLIDEVVNIKVSLEITTSLVGLYVINDERLLVLEEASIRIINSKGEVVKNKLTAFIENFTIKDNVLRILTEEDNDVIELI